MSSIQTSTGRRFDLTESLKRTCMVLLHHGIDAGVPEERETSLETWAQMLWQIAAEFEAQTAPAPGTDLLVTALREWAHAARRSVEGDQIGQAGFDGHMLAHVNAMAKLEMQRVAARVSAAAV